jgi:hypothetical protein
MIYEHMGNRTMISLCRKSADLRTSENLWFCRKSDDLRTYENLWFSLSLCRKSADFRAHGKELTTIRGRIYDEIQIFIWYVIIIMHSISQC